MKEPPEEIQTRIFFHTFFVSGILKLRHDFKANPSDAFTPSWWNWYYIFRCSLGSYTTAVSSDAFRSNHATHDSYQMHMHRGSAQEDRGIKQKRFHIAAFHQVLWLLILHFLNQWWRHDASLRCWTCWGLQSNLLWQRSICRILRLPLYYKDHCPLISSFSDVQWSGQKHLLVKSILEWLGQMISLLTKKQSKNQCDYLKRVWTSWGLSPTSAYPSIIGTWL